MTGYQITFRYEPTPPDLVHLAGSTHYSHWRACVYECLDEQGRHLYVGRSWHILQRIEQHSKGAPWYPLVAHLVVNRVASWDVACKIEQRMIRSIRPLHNVPAGGATRRRWDAYREAKKRTVTVSRYETD